MSTASNTPSSTLGRTAARTTPAHATTRIALTLFVFLIAGVAQAAGAGKTDAELTKEAMWQGFNLLLIIGLIWYFGRGAIGEFFSGRRDGIQAELTESAELLHLAEARNSELQRKLVDLESEVAGIKTTATDRAREEAARILTEAEVTAERIRTDAKAAIEQELNRAQSKLRDEAADLALQMASQKLKDNVGEADRDRLIDEFITRVEPSAEAGARG